MLIRTFRSAFNEISIIILLALIICTSIVNQGPINRALSYHPRKIMYKKRYQQVEMIHNFTLNERIYTGRVLLSNNTFTNESVNYDNNSLAFQHSILQHYIFCDVSRQGIRTFGGEFYMPTDILFPWKILPFINHTLQIYDKAVVGFCYHPQFGHVIQDMIGGILSIPSEILKGSEIFIRSNESQIKQFMTILGFDPNHVHELNEEWIFVKDLYIAVASYPVSSLQVSFRDIHDLIYKVNNLTDIVPTEYVFINKEKNNWGYVKNMDELFNFTKDFYNKYNWTFLASDYVFNISNSMKQFSRTKVFVSATGSASFNMIFMHPNCGLLLIDSRACNSPCIAIAHSLGIWMYYVASDHINRTKLTGGKIELEIFNETLSYVLSAVENKRWPEITIPSREFIDFDIEEKKKIAFYGKYKDKKTYFVYERYIENNVITKYYPRAKTYLEPK
ncbi:hypothetical protein TVAG_167230 [Trichomonas vaginalis G3]|uniref:Glycosyltransferase 61 catalytic domain-containing protein n=1 Tax=Trichomonas vaginalis (strain ATCC PRA-98 / G3) TaxID=412133 RepID=A2DED0_TRIV3|nr:glycosyltransferase family [Trichomonas vaginalis G3]EAY21348.1 hypothetical protein TVAG_167230 [Trichomonas vaginalis G3]KAI5548914.1 glycosyltransferase family [Trichomonas vaginalis G3]|eukprot:XP_001582334.1 hypothetical protein [Trichomonas vaginalis G3]